MKKEMGENENTNSKYEFVGDSFPYVINLKEGETSFLLGGRIYKNRTTINVKGRSNHNFKIIYGVMRLFECVPDKLERLSVNILRRKDNPNRPQLIEDIMDFCNVERSLVGITISEGESEKGEIEERPKYPRYDEVEMRPAISA